MAKTDVKLLPGQVKVEAWDLCVDAKDRRKNTTPHRRALVHDHEDGLTLNWGGDYPGGVTINGSKVRVLGRLEIAPMPQPQQPRPAGGTSGSTGTVTRHDPTGGTATAAPPPLTPEVILGAYLGTGPVDVLAALAKLFTELETLRQQLAKTQENWRWCKKCRVLFFAGNPGKDGECPAGGMHTLEGSGNYRLLHK